MDADAWNERYDTPEFVWDVAPNRFVEAEVGELAPGRALDLACGEGRNAVWLATKGWTVTGIDFASVAIDKARSLAERHDVADRVEFLVDDITTTAVQRGGYDLVLIAYVQLPEAERAALMQRAAAGLSPGGTLLLVAHDLANLDGGYGGPQEPSVLWTPAIACAYLDELAVERAEVIERPIDKDGEQHIALDTLVRARRAA